MESQIMCLIGEARAFAYMLLQKLFGNEPSRELFDVAFGDDAREAFMLLAVDDGGFMAAIESVEDHARSYALNAEEELSDARSAYMKLFVGPETLPAPPWESVYVAREPLLFQESTLAVRHAYRKEWFCVEGHPHVADDHIAFELDFMARLAALAVDAEARCDTLEARRLTRVQIAFLDEHLLQWIDDFARDMDDRAEDCLYVSVALLTRAFLKRDRALLEELIEET